MKVKEIMERIGITETGRAIAYIKDALEEMNTMSETHMKTQRIDLKKDKRFYDIPSDAIQIKDIRAKNHSNTKDEYRSIPRTIFKPPTEDADGV